VSSSAPCRRACRTHLKRRCCLEAASWAVDAPQPQSTLPDMGSEECQVFGIASESTSTSTCVCPPLCAHDMVLVQLAIPRVGRQLDDREQAHGCRQIGSASKCTVDCIIVEQREWASRAHRSGARPGRRLLAACWSLPWQPQTPSQCVKMKPNAVCSLDAASRVRHRRVLRCPRHLESRLQHV